jgi:hypothetical protein
MHRYGLKALLVAPLGTSGGCIARFSVDSVSSMLAQEATQEFRELFKKEYGVELSTTEAEERAEALINLYRAVLSC